PPPCAAVCCGLRPPPPTHQPAADHAQLVRRRDAHRRQPYRRSLEELCQAPDAVPAECPPHPRTPAQSLRALSPHPSSPLQERRHSRKYHLRRIRPVTYDHSFPAPPSLYSE